jgi:hypothetical protein
MRSAARLARALAASVLVALAACQGPPPPAPPPPAAQPDAPTRAREAMRRGEWSTAAPLLRQAIGAQPANVSLHYDLAVTATYLEARDEAAREFQWVLANASPDSPEYKAARSWLAEAGLLGGPPRSTGAIGATPAPSRPADKPAIVHVERTGDAGLFGRVTWSSEPGGPHSTRRLQIHLTGLPDSPTKDQRYTVRSDEEGRYEFKRIVPGPYKLSDRVAGKPTWRVRVDVPPGRDTVLDLNPTNSVNARDDFPDTAR